uniref:Serine/threonine protein phosphatase n=1 Tax=Desulfobacca acetoxidans TaxID=60893 RepID=A0A7C5ETB2_9BACT
MNGDLYVIGDLHGCLSPLKRLLEHLELDPDRDTLIFMGDYIDRGPESKGVVDYLLGLKARFPANRLVFLKGNHEAMFLDFLAGKDRELFLFNGGASTLKDYWGKDWDKESTLVLPPDHARFFQELRPYHVTENYIFVHGGLRPGIPLEEQVEEDLLWIRGEFIASSENFGQQVVFGHTPFRQPLVLPNKIGIDTGLVYGNFLTCLRLPQMDFYFVGHGPEND